MAAVAYLAHAEANDLLSQVPAGGYRLANFTPRYLGLLDYAKAAATGTTQHCWRSGADEPVSDYVAEHLETCRRLHPALADDAVVAIEIDDFRVLRAGRLILLSDIWREMLEASGLAVAEVICLARPSGTRPSERPLHPPPGPGCVPARQRHLRPGDRVQGRSAGPPPPGRDPRGRPG